MIKNNYKLYKKAFLKISEGPVGYEIQSGEIRDPQAFEEGQKILVSADNPRLLWDLLHELIGIPRPKFHDTDLLPVDPIIDRKIEEHFSKQPVETQKIFINPHNNSLESTFQSLSSKDIIKKVESEKGIKITNSLKSKKAIIKKALKIYSNGIL